MEKQEEIKKIKNLFNRINEKTYYIHISRLPKDTFEKFHKLANDDFCGDFGMTLKWLIDDMVSADTKMILQMMESIERRLLLLENKPIEKESEEPKQFKKMCDGSLRRIKK